MSAELATKLFHEALDRLNDGEDGSDKAMLLGLIELAKAMTLLEKRMQDQSKETGRDLEAIRRAVRLFPL